MTKISSKNSEIREKSQIHKNWWKTSVVKGMFTAKTIQDLHVSCKNRLLTEFLKIVLVTSMDIM